VIHFCDALAAVSEDLISGVLPKVRRTPATNSATNAIPAPIARRCCAELTLAPFGRLGAALATRRERSQARPRTTTASALEAQLVRMIITEHGAWWEILSGTEPSKKRLAPVMPLLPTMIKSAARSSATSRIASAGSP